MLEGGGRSVRLEEKDYMDCFLHFSTSGRTEHMSNPFSVFTACTYLGGVLCAEEMHSESRHGRLAARKSRARVIFENGPMTLWRQKEQMPRAKFGPPLAAASVHVVFASFIIPHATFG